MKAPYRVHRCGAFCMAYGRNQVLTCPEHQPRLLPLVQRRRAQYQVHQRRGRRGQHRAAVAPHLDRPQRVRRSGRWRPRHQPGGRVRHRVLELVQQGSLGRQRQPGRRDGSRQRNPRVRFGEPVHVYNNYYRNNELYGIASTMNGGVLVEGNYSPPLLLGQRIRRLRSGPTGPARQPVRRLGDL
jgi:hypothetical protein